MTIKLNEEESKILLEDCLEYIEEIKRELDQETQLEKQTHEDAKKLMKS